MVFSFRCFTHLSLVFFSLSSIVVSAESSLDFYTKERMVQEIDVLKNIAQVRYAPQQWKELCYGWKLKDAAAKAKERVWTYPVDNIPLKVFQRIVSDFFLSFKDYHTRVFFYSTEEARLPLHIKGIGRRYFVAYLNEQKLPATALLQVGDEVVSFDGIPIHTYVKQLKDNELASIQPFTDAALAEIVLTNRSGMYGHHVPKGSALLTLRSHTTHALYDAELAWQYSPEELERQPLPAAIAAMEEPTFTNAFQSIFNPSMLTLYSQIQSLAEATYNPNTYMMGGRYSYTPTLGKVLWESPEHLPFHAYLFEMANGVKAGYVRLPHYQLKVKDVANFGILINFFEQHTQALVIDQLNNPGGSVFCLYEIASMLTEYPLTVPRHSLAITHHEAAMAATTLPNLLAISNDEEAKAVMGDVEMFLQGHLGNYATAQSFVKYLQFILEEWQQGHIITDFTYLCGVDQIPPHPDQRYTKPILFLTNCLNFSSGDILPAILQDNSRAVLLGERTAGAGGTFIRATHINPFGIRNYGLTTSLVQRANGQIIENTGVTPDVPYQLTVRDLQCHYEGYRSKILQTLQSLIP
jgi:hypothetical protein